MLLQFGESLPCSTGVPQFGYLVEPQLESWTRSSPCERVGSRRHGRAARRRCRPHLCTEIDACACSPIESCVEFRVIVPTVKVGSVDAWRSFGPTTLLALVPTSWVASVTCLAARCFVRVEVAQRASWVCRDKAVSAPSGTGARRETGSPWAHESKAGPNGDSRAILTAT